MRCNLLVCAVVSLAVRFGECFPVKEWDAWKLRYNKQYTSPAEATEHRAIWLQHYQIFTEHMANDQRSFDMEMNEFADQILPKANINSLQLLDETSDQNDDTALPAPSSWDWREKGAVTPVRNQGQYGDELAIVAAETVESLHFIVKGTLINLSTMELHDCCTNNTVYSKDVFDCLHRQPNGGLCATGNYPLGPPHICKSNFCTATALIKGGVQLPPGNETQMKERVYKQPVMVAVDASHPSFSIYHSGIYMEPNCSTDNLDHAMQVVGYGSMDGQDYWICRNTYGVNWGIRGYILMARNQGNMCGIASNAIYPVYEGKTVKPGTDVIG